MSLTKVSYSMINGASANVLDYDADPTGATDSTTAVKNAYAALIASAQSLGVGGWKGSVSSLYFPAGTYKIDITSTSCLIPAPGAAVRGVRIVGDGPWASVIKLTGTNYFLYNNNSVGYFGFENIAFTGVNGTEQLMYYYSEGIAQRVWRQNVHTYNLLRLYNIQGNANASENTHIDCDDVHFSTTTAFITLNNTQSVNHQFYGCQVVTYYRYLDVTGGGSVFWYGGSILMNGSDYFLYVYDSGGAGVGSQNGKFSFSGLKPELRDTAKITYINAPAARVSFSDCMFATRNHDLASFVIEQYGRMDFVNCDMDYKMELHTVDATWDTPYLPAIFVNKCRLFRSPYTLVHIYHTGVDVSASGRVEMNDCDYPQAVGTYPTRPRIPADISFGHYYGFFTGAHKQKVATYQGLPDGRGLPANTNDVTFSLPEYCLVTAVLVVNTDAAAVQWRVSGPTGATWLTSTSGQKMSYATINEEIDTSNTFTVKNLTNANYGNGYILIWYI